MSIEICFIALQTKADMNELGNILLQHYNKNIVTTLNQTDETLLNNVAEKLEELSTNNNIIFDKEGFKTFIKKLFVYNLEQFGGDNSDEVEPYFNPTPTYNTLMDFTALLGFFVSIFLLYLAYENLSQITQGMTGYTPEGIGSEVMEQYNNAKEEVRRLNQTQLTYLQFFYQVFTTLGCNIVDNQIANIQQIILVGLESSFKDVSKRVTAACLASNQESKSNTMIGMVSSIFNVVSAPTASIECVNERTRIETNLIRAQIDALRESLFIEMRTKSNQIVGNVSLAVKIGIPCTSYLLSRIVYVTSKVATKISNNIKKANITDKDNENKKDFGPFRITERGGGRKKYTRKYKKYKKTLKRSRKSHIKKYKNRKQKSRKINV